MRYTSPLRYPGGKASLTNFLFDVIDLNDLRGCSYFEPYAGGAGAALGLLQLKAVSEIHINDADPRVHAFWKAAIHAHERFIETIQSIPLSIKEWHRQYEICMNPSSYDSFDVGFAAFYMNRCNRSGVLTGSGPIGGYEQKGKWRLDVRFYREALIRRIMFLNRERDRIHISCEDAINFLKLQLPKGNKRSKVFVYLDPPYVNKGQRLYLNAYKPEDHANLSQYIDNQKTLSWIMSYDDSELVRKLYNKHEISLIPIRYTLQKKRSARELIISPHRLTIPEACRIHGQESLLETVSKGV